MPKIGVGMPEGVVAFVPVKSVISIPVPDIVQLEFV